ncbi:hypothetical protein RKD52_003850 [Metabacillus sp. SLBN-84]
MFLSCFYSTYLHSGVTVSVPILLLLHLSPLRTRSKCSYPAFTALISAPDSLKVFLSCFYNTYLHSGLTVNVLILLLQHLSSLRSHRKCSYPVFTALSPFRTHSKCSNPALAALHSAPKPLKMSLTNYLHFPFYHNQNILNTKNTRHLK